MDKDQAKAAIDNLTDPKIQEVGYLLLDLDLELLGCGGETIIKKGTRDFGQVDLVYKNQQVETTFFIEVSTKADERGPKGNYFFTRWQSQANIEMVREKLTFAKTYRVARLFFDLSGKLDCPLSDDIVSKDKGNYWLTTYDFEYFVDAHGKVGRWARNDLFSYLSLKPKRPPRVPMDAIQFFLGENIRAYAYVDTAKNLLEYCYIFRRKKDDKGYQRMLEKGRIGAIAKKIKQGDMLAFPNSILVSCPDESTLCRTPAVKSQCPSHVEINIPNYFSACRVIDGQHRLLGFARVDDIHQEQHFIPVVVIENIDQHKEMKTFIEINSGQKKIDRNIILVLETDFEWDPDVNPIEFFEKQAVLVVKRLNYTRGSPLRNKVFIPEALAKRKGKITLNTLVSAILGNNFIGKKYHLFQKRRSDTETPYRTIREIFVLGREKLPRYCKDTGSFLFTNKGLRILFRLVHILERNRRKKNIRCTLRGLFDDLRKIFSDSLVERLEDFYGEGGANRACEEIFRALKKVDRQRYKRVTTDLRQV